MSASPSATASAPVRAVAPRSPVLAALLPWQRRVVRIVFWANLVCQMGIIVTGGVVRLTKSGLGCSTWPNCEPGEFTPSLHSEMGIHAFIEFGNRTLTGVLGIFAIAVLVLTVWWLRGKGRGFVVLAVLPLVGTALQAVVGKLIVNLHLHPVAVTPHFLISIGLVVISSILLARLHEGDAPARVAVPRPVLALGFALAGVGAAVLVLGTIVTGSGPHSGDVHATLRLGLDPRMVSWLHADAVMLFCGLVVGMVLIVHLARLRTHARRAAWGVLVVTLLQAVIGYTQYFTGLPALLVGLHMAGAALFTASIAWLVTTLYTWQPSVAEAHREPGVGAPEDVVRTQDIAPR